ncbi:MAG: hypothetical protein CMB68_05690 [Euryarchaeota archaeon]|nr:hypothetical protein [Euryarchaeota archaeon]|tara:strand:+ start:270 stop:608 length:339 start_codon:yes stop_codon:yes gene_type:complete
MYFTLLFDSGEGPTTIYELVFHPAAVWSSTGYCMLAENGEEEIRTRHLGPRYVQGDWQNFLEDDPNCFVSHGEGRKISIVCHEDGLGTEEDLKLLIADMKSSGFSPQILSSV